MPRPYARGDVVNADPYRSAAAGQGTSCPRRPSRPRRLALTSWRPIPVFRRPLSPRPLLLSGPSRLQPPRPQPARLPRSGPGRRSPFLTPRRPPRPLLPGPLLLLGLLLPGLLLLSGPSRPQQPRPQPARLPRSGPGYRSPRRPSWPLLPGPLLPGPLPPRLLLQSGAPRPQPRRPQPPRTAQPARDHERRAFRWDSQIRPSAGPARTW
jgi:hypothetical protein